MSTAEIIATLLSPTFIVAAIALLRKQVPRINGPYVLLAALLLSEAISLAAAFVKGATAPRELVVAAMIGVYMAVAANGGVQAVRDSITKPRQLPPEEMPNVTGKPN